MHDTGQSSFYRRAGAGRAAAPRIWHLTFTQAALLLALVAILAGCNQASDQVASHKATPTPTPTPFPQVTGTPDYTVYMTISNGVTYAAVGSEGVYALRADDGHLLWHRQVAGTISSDPLLVNGIMYISSSAGEALSYTYALRASDGAQLWRYSSNSYAFPPAISGDVAYISEQGGHVVALRASDGYTLWRASTAAPVYGAPLLMSGVVYAGAASSYYGQNNGPGYIYALHASDGRTLWRVTTDSSPYISMTMNGAVYASTNNALFALRASDGHMLWRQSIDTSIDPQLMVVNGVMYFITTKITLEGTPTTGATGLLSPFSATGDLLQSVMEMAPGRTIQPHKSGISSIYAVRMDNGAILWNYKMTPEGGNNWAQSLSIADGVIYTGSIVNQNKGYIYALRASDGALLWRHTTPNATPANAVVAAGVLYIVVISSGGDQTSMYALRASDGSQLWQHQIDGPPIEAPIVLGDTVYVGTNTGAIDALRASTGSMLWHYITIQG
jgi:outer membrane protein assembly factor BamB